MMGASSPGAVWIVIVSLRRPTTESGKVTTPMPRSIGAIVARHAARKPAPESHGSLTITAPVRSAISPACSVPGVSGFDRLPGPQATTVRARSDARRVKVTVGLRESDEHAADERTE